MEFKKYERRIAKTAYWAVIAAALAYEGLIAFSDKVKSETFKEKITSDKGVVFVIEQDRAICFWPVYQVTAFKGNETVYDSATGLKSLVPGRVEKAKRTLENL